MIILVCGEETLDTLRNILNQFRRQLRVHRQRKDSLGVLLGDRKIPPLVPQILVSRLQMNRDRIMNACSNASARKMFFQRVAMLGAYDVEMPDRLGTGSLTRKHKFGYRHETMVEFDLQAAGGVPIFQVLQLHSQHGRLRSEE